MNGQINYNYNYNSDTLFEVLSYQNMLATANKVIYLRQ